MSSFNPIRTVDGISYERIAVKTHLIWFGEDLIDTLRKYASSSLKPGDWLALSEKVVSTCQNDIRNISTVKVGWLAKLIVMGVKKYPDDKGWDNKEKMQVAVEMAGYPRAILAMVIGGLGKLVGIRGIFWMILGHRAGELDGFNPVVLEPYRENVALPPSHPEDTCNRIEKELGAPAVIIDGNNINVKIIAMSKGVPMDAKKARLVLLDNPMGQEEELTPFIIVRLKKEGRSG
ncbi:MAG TPA: coenzyme F420-0:L-glutamate ligase [Candidatus Paceibacterota bacterium]